ncbi:hypothetical protein, partial [Brevundimonas nasdae]|uniref:hypothetical protein n=1 Tax=Brevundimonas nasdae TaxID=172043 RepID=UPI003F6904DE
GGELCGVIICGHDGIYAPSTVQKGGTFSLQPQVLKLPTQPRTDSSQDHPRRRAIFLQWLSVVEHVLGWRQTLRRLKSG